MQTWAGKRGGGKHRLVCLGRPGAAHTGVLRPERGVPSGVTCGEACLMRCSIPAAMRCTAPRGSGDAQRGAAALPASLAAGESLHCNPVFAGALRGSQQARPNARSLPADSLWWKAA